MSASTVIRELPAENAAVIVVEGELDLASAPRLESALRRVMDRDTRLVVVDLCDATFIDSRGVHVLLRAAADLHRRLGGLALACADPEIVRVLELSASDTVAPHYPDREQALRALLARA